MAQVTRSVIVKGSAPKIYNLWADFENFPKFMTYIKDVRKRDEKSSYWVMDAPGGIKVDWQAEMTLVEKNKRIAWSSKDKAGFLTTSGQVTFNALPNNETEVTAVVQYAPPGGKVGEIAAALFASPDQRLKEDLHNFKVMAEGQSDKEKGKATPVPSRQEDKPIDEVTEASRGSFPTSDPPAWTLGRKEK